MEGIGGLGIGIGIGMGAMGGMGGAASGAEGAGAVGGASAASANQSAAPVGNSGGSNNSGSNQSGGPSVMLSISPEGMNMSQNSDLTAMLLMSLMDKASEQQNDSTNGGVLALALVGATAVNAYSSIQNMK